jgi:Lipase (class 3)
MRRQVLEEELTMNDDNVSLSLSSSESVETPLASGNVDVDGAGDVASTNMSTNIGTDTDAVTDNTPSTSQTEVEAGIIAESSSYTVAASTSTPGPTEIELDPEFVLPDLNANTTNTNNTVSADSESDAKHNELSDSDPFTATTITHVPAMRRTVTEHHAHSDQFHSFSFHSKSQHRPSNTSTMISSGSASRRRNPGSLRRNVSIWAPEKKSSIVPIINLEVLTPVMMRWMFVIVYSTVLFSCVFSFYETELRQQLTTLPNATDVSLYSDSVAPSAAPVLYDTAFVNSQQSLSSSNKTKLFSSGLIQFRALQMFFALRMVSTQRDRYGDNTTITSTPPLTANLRVVIECYTSQDPSSVFFRRDKIDPKSIKATTIVWNAYDDVFGTDWHQTWTEDVYSRVSFWETIYFRTWVEIPTEVLEWNSVYFELDSHNWSFRIFHVVLHIFIFIVNCTVVVWWCTQVHERYILLKSNVILKEYMFVFIILVSEIVWNDPFFIVAALHYVREIEVVGAICWGLSDGIVRALWLVMLRALARSTNEVSLWYYRKDVLHALCMAIGLTGVILTGHAMGVPGVTIASKNIYDIRVIVFGGFYVVSNAIWVIRLIRTFLYVSPAMRKLPYVATRFRQLAYRFFISVTGITMFYLFIFLPLNVINGTPRFVDFRNFNDAQTVILIAIYAWVVAFAYTPAPKDRLNFMSKQMAANLSRGMQRQRSRDQSTARHSISTTDNEQPVMVRGVSVPVHSRPPSISQSQRTPQTSRAVSVENDGYSPHPVVLRVSTTQTGATLPVQPRSPVDRNAVVVAERPLFLQALMPQQWAHMFDVSPVVTNFSLSTARWLVDMAGEAYSFHEDELRYIMAAKKATARRNNNSNREASVHSDSKREGSHSTVHSMGRLSSFYAFSELQPPNSITTSDGSKQNNNDNSNNASIESLHSRSESDDRASDHLQAPPGTESDPQQNVTASFKGHLLNVEVYGFELLDTGYRLDTECRYIIARKRNTIVIAFRGTDNATNWGSNLQLARVRVPEDFFPQDQHGCCSCQPSLQLHGGFWNTYNSVRKQLFKCIEKILENEQDGKLLHFFVTGHSLGGALSELCAFELRWKHDLDVECYTFGSPRFCNAAFQRVYDVVVPDSFRVVNDRDLVPGVPPAWFGLYAHVGLQILIDRAGNYIVAPTFVDDFFRGKNSVTDHLVSSYAVCLEECCVRRGLLARRIAAVHRDENEAPSTDPSPLTSPRNHDNDQKDTQSIELTQWPPASDRDLKESRRTFSDQELVVMTEMYAPGGSRRVPDGSRRVPDGV